MYKLQPIVLEVACTSDSLASPSLRSILASRSCSCQCSDVSDAPRRVREHKHLQSAKAADGSGACEGAFAECFSKCSVSARGVLSFSSGSGHILRAPRPDPARTNCPLTRQARADQDLLHKRSACEPLLVCAASCRVAGSLDVQDARCNLRPPDSSFVPMLTSCPCSCRCNFAGFHVPKVKIRKGTSRCTSCACARSDFPPLPLRISVESIPVTLWFSNGLDEVR